MVLTQNRRTIGKFSSHQDAKQALNQLRFANFQMAQISLVPTDNQQATQLRDKGVVNQVPQTATKLVTGNKLGSVVGLALGVGTLAIPGVGQLILAGTAGTMIAFALSSGAIGAVAGGLIGSFIQVGVTETRSQSAPQVNYLLLMEGSDEEIHRAASVLNAAKSN